MANKITWFEVMGGDVQGFYAEMFNWKIDANNPMNYGMVSEDEAGIGGGIGPDPQGGKGHVTIYIGVDDIEAALAKVEKLGGKVIMPATEVKEMNLTFAMFEDPAGHVIGLTQN